MTILSQTESTPSSSPPSSLTHVHRCIGYHNPTWHSMPTSARLMYLSVYDNRDGSFWVRTLPVAPPWSHIQRWCFWSHTLPVRINFRPKPDTVKEFNGFVSWREEWQLEQFNNVVHKNEEVTRVQRVALTDISTLGPSIDHETLGLTPGTYDSTNYFGDTASSTYKFLRQHVMQSPSIRSRASSGTRIDASSSTTDIRDISN